MTILPLSAERFQGTLHVSQRGTNQHVLAQGLTDTPSKRNHAH